MEIAHEGGLMRVFIVCLFLPFCFYSSAFALPVIYDFSTEPDGSQYPSLGLTLGVRGDSFVSTDSIGGKVTWDNGAGLGVEAIGKVDSSKTLDGSASDDVLIFDFGTDVSLVEIVFSWVGKDDEALLLVDDVTVFNDYIKPSIEGYANIVAFDFSSLKFTGAVFGIKAIDSNDSFRIQSLTVDSPIVPIPSPEPATWLLFGGGLCGFVWWRRKNKIE